MKLHINARIALALLKVTGIMKDAENRGAQIQISRNATMQCWDIEKKPNLHETVIKGMSWQMVLGSEIIRKGYIADDYITVMEVRERELNGKKPFMQDASIVGQRAIPPRNISEQDLAELFSFLRAQS